MTQDVVPSRKEWSREILDITAKTVAAVASAGLGCFLLFSGWSTGAYEHEPPGLFLMYFVFLILPPSIFFWGILRAAWYWGLRAEIIQRVRMRREAVKNKSPA